MKKKSVKFFKNNKLDEKYITLLVNKAWKKPEKVEKVAGLLEKIYSENRNYTVIVLKTLLVISGYITKGPPRCYTIPEKKSDKKDQFSALLDKIIQHWSSIAKMNIQFPDDNARSSLYSYTIVLFAY
jgi:hypothetical protein